jgi:hypothetical protein
MRVMTAQLLSAVQQRDDTVDLTGMKRSVEEIRDEYYREERGLRFALAGLYARIIGPRL